MKLIKKLREFGGEWRAIKAGFGRYIYEGQIDSDNFEIKSYAHLSPRFPDDDDSFVIMWHVHKNNKCIGYSRNPLFFLGKI